MLDQDYKYRLIAENTSDVVWIIDLESNKFVYVSPSVEQLRGFSVAEVMEQGMEPALTPSSLDHIQKLMPERFERFMQGAQETFIDELEQYRKDGNTIWTEVRARYIKNPQTGRIEIVGVTRDISEKREYEAKLIAAKNKAEESEKLMSIFLANISHDIRTPINGIMGFTELLKEKEITDQEKDKYLVLIEKSSARMIELVDNLIRLSRLDSKKVPVKIETFNYRKVIEEIVEFFQFEATSKGLFLEIEPSKNQREVILTDRTHFEAILTNLIKNALKYTQNGGVSISWTQDKNNLLVTVSDTGIGIKKEDQPIIFDRFTQVNQMSKGGFGIGLSLTQIYVNLLGGRIWCESSFGQGSRFNFTIPLQS